MMAGVDAGVGGDADGLLCQDVMVFVMVSKFFQQMIRLVVFFLFFYYVMCLARANLFIYLFSPIYLFFAYY